MSAFFQINTTKTLKIKQINNKKTIEVIEIAANGSLTALYDTKKRFPLKYIISP